MSLNVQRRDEEKKHPSKNTSSLQKLVPVTGVILAGGQSRRMGQNKAFLQLGDDPLIVHVIRRLRLVTDDLLLITNNHTEYAHLGLPMHSDILPDAGALGGIYTGLMHASQEAILCVGCDSPFLQPKLLSYLVSILGESDAVMPYTDSRRQTPLCRNHNNNQITLQTLCAVYSKKCLPIIEAMLQESELRVHALQERAHIQRVSPEVWQAFDPDGTSFFNINTPEDFERSKELTSSKRCDIMNR